MSSLTLSTLNTVKVYTFKGFDKKKKTASNIVMMETCSFYQNIKVILNKVYISKFLVVLHGKK